MVWVHIHTITYCKPNNFSGKKIKTKKIEQYEKNGVTQSTSKKTMNIMKNSVYALSILSKINHWKSFKREYVFIWIYILLSYIMQCQVQQVLLCKKNNYFWWQKKSKKCNFITVSFIKAKKTQCNLCSTFEQKYNRYTYNQEWIMISIIYGSYWYAIHLHSCIESCFLLMLK